MKLAEFHALCQREWQQGRGGEVAVLWLTENSYREFAAEAYVQEYGVSYKDENGIRDASRMVHSPMTNAGQEVSVRRNTVMNPATRGEVRLKLARDRDVAEIWIKGRMETRILEGNNGNPLQPV